MFGFSYRGEETGSLNPGTSFFSSNVPVPSEESTYDINRSLEFDSHGAIYEFSV